MTESVNNVQWILKVNRNHSYSRRQPSSVNGKWQFLCNARVRILTVAYLGSIEGSHRETPYANHLEAPCLVGKLDSVTWITIFFSVNEILILDLFCRISQHDHKISSISKKIHTRLTSCLIIIGDLIVAFCTHSISRKSQERAAPKAEQNFFY